jgi:hypothetical protein
MCGWIGDVYTGRDDRVLGFCETERNTKKE